jgi:hypothetical protein
MNTARAMRDIKRDLKALDTVSSASKIGAWRNE